VRRYTITLGALTTAGGKVISASANGRINGRQIALEGDRIFCPSCKSEGKIMCVAPRIPERWNGRQVALDNDLCACGCAVPPKLIARQNVRYQTIGQNEVPETAKCSIANNQEANNEEVIEQYFSLVDAKGAPIEGFRYDLFHEGKLHTKASSFIDGRTASVSGGGNLELVAWIPDREGSDRA
jgi:uncharacterized Zn-binding protein involved in type VI secretion